MMVKLEEIRKQIDAEFANATKEAELLEIKTKYLGRKGVLTGLLRNISAVSVEQRPQFGKLCNEIKEAVSSRIENALAGLVSIKKDQELLRERIDITLPGRGIRHGRIHPVI